MNDETRRSLFVGSVVVFIALAALGVGMMIGSHTIDDSFIQSVLLQNGAAIFGAALTFFLIHTFGWIEGGDQMLPAPVAARWLQRAVIVFVMLTLSGEAEILAARYMPDPFEQSVVQHLGAMLFGAGLTFFLVRVFRWAAQAEHGTTTISAAH